MVQIEIDLSELCKVQSEVTSTGRRGLVKKKVTVKRGGKTFQQYRWVKAGVGEPTKELAVVGLNKPKPVSDGKLTSMTKDNVVGSMLLSDMGAKGGIHKDNTSVLKFEDEAHGIYKTISDIAIFGEVNTYATSEILNFDVVPESVGDDFGRGEGSCQKWIPETEGPYDDFSLEGCKIGEKHFDDLAKIFVMDIVNGNGDRHKGNVVIDKSDRCWAIDNEDWGSEIAERNILSLDGEMVPSDKLYSPMMKWMGKIIAPEPGVFEKKPEDGGKENRRVAFSKFKEKVIENMKIAIDKKDEIIGGLKSGMGEEYDERISNVRKNMAYMEKYIGG